MSRRFDGAASHCMTHQMFTKSKRTVCCSAHFHRAWPPISSATFATQRGRVRSSTRCHGLTFATIPPSHAKHPRPTSWQALFGQLAGQLSIQRLNVAVANDHCLSIHQRTAGRRQRNSITSQVIRRRLLANSRERVASRCYTDTTVAHNSQRPSSTRIRRAQLSAPTVITDHAWSNDVRFVPSTFPKRIAV